MSLSKKLIKNDNVTAVVTHSSTHTLADALSFSHTWCLELSKVPKVSKKRKPPLLINCGAAQSSFLTLTLKNLIIVLARTMFIFKISLEHDLIGYLHDHREPKLEAGEKNDFDLSSWNYQNCWIILFILVIIIKINLILIEILAIYPWKSSTPLFLIIYNSLEHDY